MNGIVLVAECLVSRVVVILVQGNACIFPDALIDEFGGDFFFSRNACQLGFKFLQAVQLFLDKFIVCLNFIPFSQEFVEG